MQFSLMFFAASEDGLTDNKYELVIESAKFGDRHGFSSIWVPERHFTKLGSLYPNPAVLHAALARETSRIQLRAGSVVLPLHHPVRVAEEWAVVDNLSQGRVGISFASGWNPTDFAFFPERYQNRHAEMIAAIETVQKLWRGEQLDVTDGKGQQVSVRMYPTPVQPELPVWVTCAGNPQTFRDAGALGANLLTHVLDQSIETLAENIGLYRRARAAHGHAPDAGLVTVMIHTFVGDDADVVREQAREPYCRYLKSNIGLLKGLSQSRGQNFDITTLPDADIDAFVHLLYDRFATTRGLIGTPDTCLDVVRQLAQAGVDEIACLLDFGPDAQLILQNLPHLQQLQERCAVELVKGGADRAGHAAPHTRPSQTIPQPTLSDIQRRCTTPVPVSEFYADLRRHGVHMDTTFQGIQELRRHEQEALGLIQLPAALIPSADSYILHPAFFDACLQVFVAALPAGILSDQGALYLPVGFRHLRTHGRPGQQVWSHARLRSVSQQAGTVFEGEVQVFDEAGRLVIEVEGLQLQQIEAARPSGSEQLGSWLYDIQWHPQPLPADTSEPAQPGLWLVFVDQSGIGAQLIARLQERGETCLAVAVAEHEVHVNAPIVYIDPAHPHELHELIKKVLSRSQLPCRGIVHAWSLDICAPEALTAAALERDQLLGVVSALHLVQALHTLHISTPRLWLVTRGVQPAGRTTARLALAQAPLWGWGRALPLEWPQLWSCLVDLDADAAVEASADQLFDTVWKPDQEDQIALRAGTRLVARLERDPNSTIQPRDLAIRPDATYLITGGLGNLGLLWADWLVAHGARHLVLLGRSGVSEAAGKVLEHLEQIGAQLLVVPADVADSGAMTAVFEQIAAGWPGLRGIIHAAGVTSYHTIDSLDADRLMLMLRPKVSGTWVLHQLCQSIPLDFFVCISSLSPVWGTKGLGHYAAANHFLDIFGHYGQQIQQPVTTINLGPIAGGGMVAATATVQTAMTQGGLGLLQPAPALNSIAAMTSAGVAQKIIADVDWTVFKQLHEMSGRRPFLERVGVQAVEPELDSQLPSTFLRELEHVPPGKWAELLTAHLQIEVGRVLKLDPSRQPDPHQGFFDMGMDSLMVLDLKNRLQKSLGCPLPTTLPFEYPTIEALTAYLSTRLFPDMPSSEDAAAQQVVEQPDSVRDIKSLTESELKRLIDAELETLIDD